MSEVFLPRRINRGKLPMKKYAKYMLSKPKVIEIIKWQTILPKNSALTNFEDESFFGMLFFQGATAWN